MSFARKLYLSIFPTIFLLLSPTIHSAQKPWVAVHDFTASKNLNEIGITGWSVAGKLENELVQTGKFRLVVREKIGKVLKEKNVSSTSSLKPSAFGKMIGAEYIVTGSLTLRGKKLILIGKLIDVTKETEKLKEVLILFPPETIPLPLLTSCLICLMSSQKNFQCHLENFLMKESAI